MLVDTLRLINRWKPCSSPTASSNQDSVANFLRWWKIVISNLGARGPLVLPSKSRLFLHVNEFLFFHQFLLTLTLFTRHTNQRVWYLNHFLSELKVALFWKGARYFLLVKEQTGKKSWQIMIDQRSARRWSCFLSEAKIVIVEKKCPNHFFLVFFPVFCRRKASRSALKCYVVNEGNSVGMSAARVWVETNI